MSKDFANLGEKDLDTLNPVDGEEFARWIIRKIGEAQIALSSLQEGLAQTEADYNLAMAQSRLDYGNKSRADGKNYTETQKEDQALVDNSLLAEAFLLDKAKVEVYKGKIRVLQTQSELVRSVMVSIRESSK